MNSIILGLGSNLGDRLAHLRGAHAALKTTPNIAQIIASAIYETPPWGAAGSPAFLNACVLIKTTLPLDAVLGVCLGIESAMGRSRDTQNQFAPRVIDLDVLFAGDLSSQAPHLYVPHPRLHLRAFALKPALDVWPHPQLQAWFDLPTVQADAAQLVKTPDHL
jgi:2-amino-4-hydroxy-6-hydroxymethyldihydropteridine diphosphokinase